MNFLYSYLLYFIMFVPFIFVLLFFVNRKRNKQTSKFVLSKYFTSLINGYSKTRYIYRVFFICLCISFLIISLARPRWGKIIEEVFVSGNNVVVVFDVSRSMLAQDLKPSRLSQAKHSVEKFIDNSGADRIALIAFSASSVLVSPLSSDHEALKMYLKSLDTNFISSKGTSLSKGLKMAGDLLVKDQNSDAKRIVLLVTDGEDHEGKLPLKFLEENKVTVYSLAVGLESGGAIPIYSNGGMKSGYLKDKKGNMVISKVNTELLNKISGNTGGNVYYTSFSGDEVLGILDDINSGGGKKKLKDKFNIKYIERYRYFLIPAIIILGVLI